MPSRAVTVLATAILVMPFELIVVGAQTPEITLDSFLSQNIAETGNFSWPVLKEWTSRHPEDSVQAPPAIGQEADSPIAKNLRDRALEGHWCLRSTAEIDLAGGIRVRRTALFYQPLVEQIYDKPLPPLPTESGSALREHGCRLVKIFFEFQGATDPHALAEEIARQIPGERSDEPGKYITSASSIDYWKPLYTFEVFSLHRFSYWHLFTRRPGARAPDDPGSQPAVLLELFQPSEDYGPPSSKTVNPEAGQPWLPLRVAQLARLPEAPTLEMLAFLAPQAGDRWEQPTFQCDSQLVPVLRKWLALAAQATPRQHAAALLLADAVADRLSDCDELADSSSPEVGAIQEKYYDDLKKNLHELGIETDKSARPGPEYYAGNLIEEARKLAPDGVVNELSWIATLDQRCQWSSISDSHCAQFIQQGERFLTRFPSDEWTPSVHLLLAEAYSITAEDRGPDSDELDLDDAGLLKKAAAHYRAWYASSANERDRALVWQEIWGLDAGLGPWLMVPDQLRQ
ncbi:MAG: hypothetical protein WBE76_28265 [Terracidiphilus sp.]